MVCRPWQGAVALKEQHPEMTQYHIIQNWLWLGVVNSLEEATTLIRTPGLITTVIKFFVSRCFPVTMKLLNLIRRMTSEPVDFTEQQFTLRL